jgi:hypothetical protein
LLCRAICIFTSSLHLACGVSRATITIILKFLDIVIKASIQISQNIPLLSDSDTLDVPIPHDVHTVETHIEYMTYSMLMMSSMDW